ncbi:LysR family transcriptional regulator [Paenarthrobacter sp. NPDC089714]|uniref:LysR family transcriptional regulator n=1 Tax=Paenarthrobacter sp. NPDC089714 TaxID=3364377 RepID=UPI003808A5B2
MELRQLRYIIAVADHRSFTKAAAACFVVQSALSHQIKTVEQELGEALFARTSRRVELTQAGEVFLPAAREAVAAADRAMESIAAQRGHITGTLALGVNATLTAVDVPVLLRSFRSRHPGVSVRLVAGNSGELMERTQNGELDVTFLALATPQAPVGLEHQMLVSEPLVVTLWDGHPLADRASLRVEDLKEEIFVDFPPHTTGRAQADAAFAKVSTPRSVAFEISDIALLEQLIEQELAIALIAKSVATRLKNLKAVPLVDAPSRNQYIAWGTFNPKPATFAFVTEAVRITRS